MIIVESLKILVPTTVAPNLRNSLIDYVNLISKELIKKTDVEILWFVYMNSKINSNDNTNIFDIHSFQNGLEFLNHSKPDLILVNDYMQEPIHQSLIIAAKFLKIPIVAFYLYNISEDFAMTDTRNYFQKLLIKIKRTIRLSLMSKNIGESEKRLFSRVRFFMYKRTFLKKTIESIGKENMKILHNNSWKNQTNWISTLADLHILSNDSWIEYLKRIGISENKIVVTGNPIFDPLFKLPKQDFKRKDKSKIFVLILTDSLYEHGFWSENERDSVLKSILIKLASQPDISFALKIHPASEDINYYKSLIGELKINVPIYQKEFLFDLISDFDLVLTYGCSFAHVELGYLEKKMIFYDVNAPYPKLKIIDAGIKSGFIKVCTDIDDLIEIINELQKYDDPVDEEFLKIREKITFKSDANSSERISSEFLNLLQK